MTSVNINKVSAGQRQIDAAVRMLFGGEDSLAVHTVAAAAHGILEDLAELRRRPMVRDLYENALRELYQRLLGKTTPENIIRRELPNFTKLIRDNRNRPANFLKHADRDPKGWLDSVTLGSDDLLLHACCLYADLGFKLTTEMDAFCRWHLAVYPHEDNDVIRTAAGQVHHLTRAEQIEFGEFLVDKLKQTKNNADFFDSMNQ